MLNSLSVFVYPLFHLFFLSSQIYQNLLFLHTHINICILMHISIYIYIVEDDPKDHFSIAGTLKCWGGRYSFPWIAPLYPWSLQCWVLSKAASSTIFLVFGMTRAGIKPWSPGSLANTQLIRPMAPVICIYIYVNPSMNLWANYCNREPSICCG